MESPEPDDPPTGPPAREEAADGAREDGAATGDGSNEGTPTGTTETDGEVDETDAGTPRAGAGTAEAGDGTAGADAETAEPDTGEAGGGGRDAGGADASAGAEPETGATEAAADDPSDDYVPPKLSNGLRAPLRDPAEWFFLVENRLVIAGGLLLVLLGLLFAVELATDFAEQGLQPLFYTFGALIGGNFTLVTIVVSISQLVISQQLGSPGDLRRQIEETNEYRAAVEDETDRAVAPVTPTDFLRLLLGHTQRKLDVVRSELDELDAESEAHADLEALVERLASHVGRVNVLLCRDEVGLFEALSVTLETNYSQDIYRARSIQAEYREAFSEELTDAIEDIVVRLQQIDVARQYLKTLYMQNELAIVSRYLLYTGTPAVLVAVFVMHQFAASNEATILEPETLSTVIPVALAICVAPLAVLFAFVLRISTVAQRTLAVTPFTTPAQERSLIPDAVHRPGGPGPGVPGEYEELEAHPPERGKR